MKCRGAKGHSAGDDAVGQCGAYVDLVGRIDAAGHAEEFGRGFGEYSDWRVGSGAVTPERVLAMA